MVEDRKIRPEQSQSVPIKRADDTENDVDQNTVR